MPRLKDKYASEVVPALEKKFGYKNINEVPKLDKVVLNIGMGDVKDNPKALEFVKAIREALMAEGVEIQSLRA